MICRHGADPSASGTAVHAQQPAAASLPSPTRLRPAATSSTNQHQLGCSGAFLVFGMQAGYDAEPLLSGSQINVLVSAYSARASGLCIEDGGSVHVRRGNASGWHLPGIRPEPDFHEGRRRVDDAYPPIPSSRTISFVLYGASARERGRRTLFVGDVLCSLGASGCSLIFGAGAGGPTATTDELVGPFISGLMNFRGFAGSTVVHSIGGWVVIAGAITGLV